MVILSDIIMGDYTSDDIIIDGLARYWDITKEDLGELTMYLRESNASTLLYVFILDHSDEKKDSALLYLKTSCGDFHMATKLALNDHNIILVSSIDKISFEKTLETDESELRLTTNAGLTQRSLLGFKENNITLQTNMLDRILNIIKIYPIGCKLATLDDMYLYELDPFYLYELDYYGIGTRLVSKVEIDYELNLGDFAADNLTVQSPSLNLDVSPLLKYYDEYLVCHFDKYNMDEMDRKTIL